MQYGSLFVICFGHKGRIKIGVNNGKLHSLYVNS